MGDVTHTRCGFIARGAQVVIALAALVALPAATVAQQATAPMRVYVAPDDHTDYMWEGDEEQYRHAYLNMIDFYLDLADKTAALPSDQQSRFDMDGSLWLTTYEKNRSPEQFQRLVRRIRDGHMSFPLNSLVSTYGGTPTEAVLRGMYPAGALERRYDLRTPLAIAMENQTLPLGLGALWAGSGAKYSWKGICGCLTRLNRVGERPHEIYWWTAQDGSRILMKWNSLHGNTGARSMGGYAEARTPAREIGYVASDPHFKSIYPYNVIGVFGKGWDDLQTLTDEFPKVAKDNSTPAVRVISSNMLDFFSDFERTYGTKIPNYAASFGNEWDLYTASMQEVSSNVRRSVEQLRAAEAMASVVVSRQPDFMGQSKTAREAAWQALGLYWEHNWTADSPNVSRNQRAAWQRRVAGDVSGYVRRLHGDSADALAAMITAPKNSRRFYVFNPLGWERSDVADVPLEPGAPVHVVDVSTGREVLSQRVKLPVEGEPAGRNFLRIWAEHLPAIGYRVFEVVDGPAQTAADAATVSSGGKSAMLLENSLYRLKVESNGSITSLLDKTTANREFAGYVDSSRQRINDLGQDIGTLTVENAGPVSVTLKAVSDGPLAHTSRITLFRNSQRIDIRNEITQNFDGLHTWGFTFKLDKPRTRHEEVGAIADARLLADGGSYSPDMSRLEWLTLNHFVDMTGSDNAGVTLSNWDLSFMKLGDSEIHDQVSRLDTATPQVRVLAGGQIDAPQAGIPKQGGDSYFLQRFALTTHAAYDATAAMRFSLEHQNPTVAAWVDGGGTALPEKEFSLLQNSNANVLLWSVKPAETDNGDLTVRTWNVGDAPQQYSIGFTAGIARASTVNHLEVDQQPMPLTQGKVQRTATPTQIQTVEVTLKK